VLGCSFAAVLHAVCWKSRRCLAEAAYLRSLQDSREHVGVEGVHAQSIARKTTLTHPPVGGAAAGESPRRRCCAPHHG
jgi:hypothetical protein